MEFGRNVGFEQYGTLNALKIEGLKYWLGKIGFPQSILILEHIDGRNAVFLRLVVGNTAADIEAGWLDAVHRERQPSEIAYVRIMERFALTQQVAVA